MLLPLAKYIYKTYVHSTCIVVEILHVLLNDAKPLNYSHVYSYGQIQCIYYAFRAVTNILTTNNKIHQDAKPKPYYFNHYHNKIGYKSCVRHQTFVILIETETELYFTTINKQATCKQVLQLL